MKRIVVVQIVVLRFSKHRNK